MPKVVASLQYFIRPVESWEAGHRRPRPRPDPREPLDLIRESRSTGTVLPLRDSQRTAEVIAHTEVIEL